ncbi:MAG: hypothetical protein PHX83_06640 [Acidobacteriia bacterium]|nr:hypothetical protein [Terriglobia bacterium]
MTSILMFESFYSVEKFGRRLRAERGNVFGVRVIYGAAPIRVVFSARNNG